MSGTTREHHIGLVPGKPFTWATYCVECTEAEQMWVAACKNGWHHAPPAVLVSLDRVLGASDAEQEGQQ